MNPDDRTSFPFLIREMLRFGSRSNIEIVCRSQADAAVTLRIRLVNREGISEFAHTTVATGVVTTTTHKISDIPILISVIDDGGTLQQGSAYVTLALRIDGEIVYELCSGFVYNQKAISWPYVGGQDMMPGRGKIKEVAGAEPAAGDELSITVPTGRVWHILGLSFQLVTGAAATARVVRIRYDGPSGVSFQSISGTTQADSLTRNYFIGRYGAIEDQTDNLSILVNMPNDMYIGEAGSILSSTTNIIAGDNYSTPTILVEEFFAVPV